MLFISEQAKTKVQTLLSKEGKDQTHFVRVSVVAGGCSGFSYKMDFDDKVADTDEVFEDKGMKIVTDAKSVLYLFGTTLDFSSGLEGKGFYFSNPNAERTCGCGESFAL